MMLRDGDGNGDGGDGCAIVSTFNMRVVDKEVMGTFSPSCQI